jgi:hypothetical protein
VMCVCGVGAGVDCVHSCCSLIIPIAHREITTLPRPPLLKWEKNN